MTHATPHAAGCTAAHPDSSPDARSPQRVVVVNGNPQVLDLLDRQLDGGLYDMVFVESTDRAYSQIRKLLPELVVLCSSEHDLDTCQLLTMLKLDMDTCDIPILTWAPEADGALSEDELFPDLEDDLDLLPRPASPAMN